MSIVTINPNADNYAFGLTPSGAASVWQALSDAGAAYVAFTPGMVNDGAFQLGTVALAGRRVAALRVIVNVEITTPVDFFTLFFNNAGQESLLNHYIFPVSGNIAYGRWITERPGGGEWTQVALDSAQAKIFDANRNPGKPKLNQLWVEVDLRDRVTVSAVLPTGAIGTRTPVIQWTFTDPDGGEQSAFQVKIFTSAQVATGGFDPDIFPPVIDSGLLTGTQKLYPLAQSLEDGSYRAYVRAAKDHLGSDWYSTWVSGAAFTIDSTPLAPTAVTPANAATVNTDVPFLGATVTAQPLGGKSRVRWQLATNAGFTTELKDITEPTTALRDSGATTYELPAALQLRQTVWYLRAAQVSESGVQGPWSATQSFTVAHVPSTATWAPTGTAYADFGSRGRVVLSWDFVDTSVVDYQTAYQVIVETNAGGAILDTGKVLSSAGQAVVTLSAGYKDQALRWRVRVWDTDDVVSAYSANQSFFVGDPAVVNITSPAQDGNATSPDPVIAWSFVAGGGRTQANYQLQVTYHDDVIYDSGVVVSATASHDIPTPVLANNKPFKAVLYVTDSKGLTSVEVSDFETAYAGPARPAAVIDASLFDANGYVKITWTDGVKASNFVSWRVYRLRSGEEEFSLIHETSAVGPHTFFDWYAGGESQYVVVQVTVTSGFNYESLFPDPVPVTIAEGTDYWLLHPTDDTKHLRLRQVTQDSLSEEYEEADLNVLDRGRKKDYGTRYGYTGSLTCQLRDVEGQITAREMKQSIEALKRERVMLYLRNPFGDVWQVGAGNMSFSRLSGMGTREYGDLTIPYSEVF